MSPELSDAAIQLTGTTGRGRVIADGAVAATTLLGLARRRPVIYNAHNLESAFRPGLGSGGDRRYALGTGPARGDGRAGWSVAPTSMAPRRSLRAQRCATSPTRSTSTRSSRSLGPRTRAGCSPPTTHAPNREALAFLVGQIMPLRVESLPDATLAVTGRGLELPAGTDPRVEALGFVDDIGAVYATAACAAVPLLSGGGSPLKFSEAGWMVSVALYGKPWNRVACKPVLAAGRAAARTPLRGARIAEVRAGAAALARAARRIAALARHISAS